MNIYNYSGDHTKKIIVQLNGHSEYREFLSIDATIDSMESFKQAGAKVLKRKYNENARAFYFKDGIEIDEADIFFLKDNEVICYSHKGDDFKYKQILDMYKTIKKLGQGGFGKVYLGEEIATGKLFAIKYIDTMFFMSKADLVKEIFRESKTLSVLTNKNIISLYRTFLYNESFVLIMEYAPHGELKKYVQDNKGLSEVNGKLYIILSLKYTFN